MRPRKTGSYTEFGNSVSAKLTESNATTTDLAKMLNVGQPHVSLLLTGQRKASPRWTDLIADVLNLSDKERRELHLKAARSVGFKL